MKKLVTFDAAGTLIDHRWDPAAIALAAAAEHSLNFQSTEASAAYAQVEGQFQEQRLHHERMRDHAAIDALWQKQMATWLEKLGASPDYAPEVLKTFRRNAFSKDSHIWALYDDVVPTLDRLASDGAKIGIISNWDHTLHVVLENLGIKDRFHFVIASLEFGYEKPDPKIFNEALTRGGASKDEALHIGDSETDDYRGALASGFSALFLSRDEPADYKSSRISSLTQIWEAMACLC